MTTQKKPAILVKETLPPIQATSQEVPEVEYFSVGANLLRQKMLDPNYAPIHETFIELE